MVIAGPDEALRGAMVDRLVRSGVLWQERVERAMRSVPRHRFIPDEPLASAYADEPCLVKRDRGRIVSTISQPTMVAIMLQLAAISDGDTVLEVGTGSGYNAALLCELTGSEGAVTTIEIDADLAARAERLLEDAGYGSVDVRSGHGEAGVPERSPYDVVIVTAGAPSIAAAWKAQLHDGGRLVVPIQERRSVLALESDGDELRMVREVPGLFVPMR